MLFSADEIPDPEPSLDIKCRAEYDPDNEDYTIIGEWTVSDPLASEMIPFYSTNLESLAAPTSRTPTPISGTSMTVRVIKSSQLKFSIIEMDNNIIIHFTHPLYN